MGGGLTTFTPAGASNAPAEDRAAAPRCFQEQPLGTRFPFQADYHRLEIEDDGPPRPPPLPRWWRTRDRSPSICMEVMAAPGTRDREKPDSVAEGVPQTGLQRLHHKLRTDLILLFLKYLRTLNDQHGKNPFLPFGLLRIELNDQLLVDGCINLRSAGRLKISTRRASLSTVSHSGMLRVSVSMACCTMIRSKLFSRRVTTSPWRTW